jgi:hypothetical protein
MNQSTSFDADGRQWGGFSTMTRPITVTGEEEREFQMALEVYKERSGRLFPTWSEILEVLQALGYAKRIWKPVGLWAPIVPGPLGSDVGEEPTDLLGWFSRVETPVGP